MKNLLSFLFAIMAVTVFSTGVSAATGINPYAVGAGSTVLSAFTPSVSGLAYAGLNKELWLPFIMEKFIPDDSWINELRDLSAFVDNDQLHIADAGVNPDVLVNNTDYPIVIKTRTDGSQTVEVDTLDTENTVVRNAEAIELSYNKRESVTRSHKAALLIKFLEMSAHAVAPSSNSADTPVLTTSGEVGNDGLKKLTFADLLALEAAFDEAEVPSEGRVLVLNAKHKSHLMAEDLKLYNQVFAKGNMSYAGFTIYVQASKRMPVYNNTNGTKVAFGEAPAGTDAICSIAFHKEEAFRCKGTASMFARLDDPEARGDIIGFQQRVLSGPMRGKGIGAIYSVA